MNKTILEHYLSALVYTIFWQIGCDNYFFEFMTLFIVERVVSIDQLSNKFSEFLFVTGGAKDKKLIIWGWKDGVNKIERKEE